MNCCTPTTTQQTVSTPTAATQQNATVSPRYTVKSGQDAYQVRVELPGVPKNNVSVAVDKGILSVNATRQSAAQENWRTVYRELSQQSYALRLKLNVPVNEDALSAKLEDGVLTLTLPVKEAAKPREISVA